jgi:hypothetical protein
MVWIEFNGLSAFTPVTALAISRVMIYSEENLKEQA